MLDGKKVISPSPSANVLGREKYPQLFFLISIAVVSLFLLFLLAALYPFQPWSPLWYLKAGQVAVDYSVTLLFGFFLSLMAISMTPRNKKSVPSRTLVRRLITAALISYSILIPIQLFGYGLYWLNTGQQTQQAIRKANSDFSSLRSRINASQTNAQLLAALGRDPAIALPTSNAASLASQKQRVVEAINSSEAQMRINYERQRKLNLTSLMVGTLKGILGAAIVALVLYRVNNILKPLT